MNFDALTTAAVRDELTDKALGGRVQKVLLPSESALALELHANGQTHWLFASFHPQHARVQLSDQRYRRMIETETPLLLLLRKHVRDGRLINVEQLPLERVLILTIAKRLVLSESEEQAAECKLIIEIMGRYSNIILVDSRGIILDCAKHVHPNVNRYRVLLPRRKYVPPPPQPKLAPTDCTPASLMALLQATTGSKRAWQVLVEGFRAVSPLLAREVVYRAVEKADATVEDTVVQPNGLEAISRALVEMFDPVNTHDWSPSVVRNDQSVEAFAPYTLTHLAGASAVSGISEAISTYYSDLTTRRPHQLARTVLLDQIEENRQRLLRKKDSLERGLERATEAARLRTSGELILSYIAGIEPGQSILQVDDLTIELDPRLTAVENAQAYFREYSKAKAAMEEVPGLLEETGLSLAYLDQMSGLVEIADDASTIGRLRDELSQAGFGARQQEQSRPRKRPSRGKDKGTKTRVSPLRLKVDGFDVWVGRSGHENDEVTFGLASGNDLWLHAHGVPGSHVVVSTSNGEPPDTTLRKGAELAAWFSQARDSARVIVDCTRRKYVRKIKGAPPGMVTYTNETTYTVKPRVLATTDQE